ncbi:hypothetical protein CAMGR0001_0314 [Campylobacter gracilis RM3268]|uniref:Uncharacterized protein n=1 Tax=Campylobacter gracilis RM3268 TaxID=553220 RepID=C8PKU1_9BACT|nr:hypothetical protein CAMGR0001_0314 [Campylobacter gracilis RM3268]
MTRANEISRDKFYEKAPTAFDISAIISIPTTKFYCNTRCSGVVPFAKPIIRIYAPQNTNATNLKS